MYRVQPYTRPDTGHCPAAPRAPASAVRAPAPGIAPRQCSVSQSVVGSSDVARRSSRRRTFVRVSASHSPIVLPIQPPRVAFVRLWRVSRREQPRRRDNTVEVEPPASLFARVVSCLWRCFGGQVRVRCTICTSGRRAHFSRSTHDGFGVSLPSTVFGSRVFRSFYAFRHAAQMYTLYTVVVTRRSRRLDQPTIQIVLAQWRHTRTPAMQMSDHASPIKMASPTAMSFAATHCKHAPLSFGATMWAFSLAPSEVVSWSSSGRSAGPSMLSSNL